MDDQNNKKGFDDFFAPEEPKRSDNSQPDDGDKAKEEKSSYYYSYGPKPDESERNRATDPVYTYDNDTSSYDANTTYSVSNQSGTAYYAASEHEQANSAPQTQLKTFTTSPAASGKGGWQVREPRRTSFRSMFLSFLAGVLVVGGLMYTADVRNWFTSGNAVTTQTQSEGNTSGSPASVASGGDRGSSSAVVSARPDNISDLFDMASPAVVKIETFVNATQRSNRSSILDDPFFRQFFGDNYPGQSSPQQGENDRMQQTGIGTGFFFEADGHILTNQHVIGEADEIRITVQGYEKPFTGKLLGSSYELDLAVVKIEGDQAFPTLPLGSSEDINIGDWVVAIGNPYGFDHTVTVGVLSAKERPIDIPDRQGERRYKHLLQTDASINPGNSGGPLLNTKGEVVGINTAVSSQAQGIGFAIPTTTIQSVLDNLKNNTEIPREPVPFIGADLNQINEEIAKQLGLEKAEGSLVRSVYYNSPAYLADLKQFDVILGIEGKRIGDMNVLISEIQSRKVGDKVEFNILRQGNEINLTIEIGDRVAFGLD